MQRHCHNDKARLAILMKKEIAHSQLLSVLQKMGLSVAGAQGTVGVGGIIRRRWHWVCSIMMIATMQDSDHFIKDA